MGLRLLRKNRVAIILANSSGLSQREKAPLFRTPTVKPGSLAYNRESPARFLSSLQSSSRFNEGERIRLGAAPGEEKQASSVCGQCCFLGGLLSYPEGFGVIEVTSKFNREMWVPSAQTHLLCRIQTLHAG